jgi:hypothetical protein
MMEVLWRAHPQELVGFAPHDLDPVTHSMRERAGNTNTKSDIKFLAKFQRAVIIVKDLLLPNEEATIARKAGRQGKHHNLLRLLFKSRAYEVSERVLLVLCRSASSWSCAIFCDSDTG